MSKDSALAVFEGKNIRRTWFNDEWWFSILDIISVLTNSADPKQYIKKMRSRDPILHVNWGTLCTPLDLPALDNKIRKTNCVNTEGAFRIIQSIPSLKAEPFKLWLAKTGYDRVREIDNPELASSRIKETYRAKGYSEDWIEKRMRGIAVRQELTDEWKNRGIAEEREFAILTNEISKATFGKTIEEYKQLKKLNKENLRDHMTDLELIFNMLGERVTTEITKKENVQGFIPAHAAAKRGGRIAGNARKETEEELGRSIITNENYLTIPEKKKRKEIS